MIKTLKVSDIIKGTFCVSIEDGLKIYNKIVSLINGGYKIFLSFENVEIVVPCFLNVAIGRLYGKFTEKQINEQLSVINIRNSDFIIFNEVVNNAKIYFVNQQSFDNAWENI